MVDGHVNTNWRGDVYVDEMGEDNEDPYVFNDPWLYSYCHAPQLRRTARKGDYLQIGSKIIFTSADKANEGFLSVDTFFVIGGIQKWSNDPTLALPTKYKRHFQNNGSDLWTRHFRFPFIDIHSSVSHTYEAELWQINKPDFSYLPYNRYGAKVSIPFDSLNKKLADKIRGKVWGKYPVLLSDVEVKVISNQIEKFATIKVLRDVRSDIIVH